MFGDEQDCQIQLFSHLHIWFQSKKILNIFLIQLFYSKFKLNIYINRAYGNNPDTHLPTSATCFFQLKLPNYSTYLIMYNKLKYAIKNCSEIDADFNVNEND
jgi:hypothetical protein